MLGLLLFVLVLSVLVVGHEFGHFWFARKAGMTVEEFGLGFPPTLFSWKDKPGTVWTINLIPLGGFVRIKGENGEDADGPGSFRRASYVERLLVLIGGVAMNVLLAWVLYSAAALGGAPAILERGEENVRDRAVTVIETVEGAPADGKVEIGERVTAINGVQVATAEEALRALNEASTSNQEVRLTVEDGKEPREVVLTPAYIAELDRAGVGVGLVDTGIVQTPWYLAPWYGLRDLWFAMITVCQTFGALLVSPWTGSSLVKDLAGPVGIAVMTGQAAQLGIIYLLRFAALLSVNLAVLNALPFPALDGGRIALLALERLRRKALAPKTEALVHALGFGLLLLLVVMVTYQDIFRLF